MVSSAADHPWLALAAGAALVAIVVALLRTRRRGEGALANPPATEPCPAVSTPGTRAAEIHSLLGDVREGSVLDGCEVVRIYEDDRGCVPVLLAGRHAATFRIDVLRRDPEGGPPPLAATEKLALYLAGVAEGSATPERCGRGANALAAALAAAGADPPPWLLTMRAHARLVRAGRTPPR